MLLKLVCLSVFMNTLNIRLTESTPNNDPYLSISLSERSSIEELKAGQDQLRKLLDDVLKKLNQTKDSLPSNCVEATAKTKQTGIYEILVPSYSSQSFRVPCDAEQHDGGWAVFLRRMDGSVDFHRNWSAYKAGFGDLNGEFFLGLDKLHALTDVTLQQLLVILEDFDGNVKYELYDKFAIGNENEDYNLHTLGTASGTAGDSLSAHHGMKFTTSDRDNDRYNHNCADLYFGAWWYKSCHSSHLTGKYKDNIFGEGINWKAFRGFEYSLKRAVMMIKPRN